MVSDAATALTPGYVLYPYQRQVLADLLTILTGAERRVVAHLPTGAGKTRIACRAAATLLNQHSAEGKVVVWLASSEELCEQAADDLAEAWRHVGNRRAAIHRYWGEARLDLDGLEEGFLIAGLPKLWAARKPGFLAGLSTRTAAVIFDEAHQAIAETYSFVTEQLATYDPPVLGLTATPGRTSDMTSADRDLAEMFNRNKVTIDAHGHGSPVTRLISQGYLAEPRFIRVSVRAEVELRKPSVGRDYHTDDLVALGRDRAWREQVAEIAVKALGRHRRVLVFCPSVRCAEDAARVVACEGFNTASVTADTLPEHRRAVIETFKGDEPERMALFNYGVLTTGFDAPRTSCVVVARPTTSLVLYSQMVGRAMRGRESGGNRRCEIYTVVDTDQRGFGSVVEAFDNWEELWQQQDSNN